MTEARPWQTGLMAMREDCRHFQSRTYTTGEVARFCVPDRDREQEGLVEDEPDMPEGDVASLLDAADLIVTAAGPEIVAEIESERQARPWWKVWKKKEGGGFDLSAH